MKHIKEYIKFKINESKELFTEVTKEEYRDMYTTHDIGDGKRGLSKSSIDYISQRVSNLAVSPFDFATYISKGKFVNPSNTVIEEVADEWFLIKDIWKNKYYKCDQLDGIVDCLKYIFSSPYIFDE